VRRLDELSERLARLKALSAKSRNDFARRLAPVAGFRKILAHEYLNVDWDKVYDHLQNLDDLTRFGVLVREWLVKRAGENQG